MMNCDKCIYAGTPSYGYPCCECISLNSMSYRNYKKDKNKKDDNMENSFVNEINREIQEKYNKTNSESKQKDYTLSEAKEILQKYFELLPKDSNYETSSFCKSSKCEQCLFDYKKSGVDCDLAMWDENLIAEAEQYVEEYTFNIDWSEVPIGTPVLCWNNDHKEKYKKFFFLERDGALWATSEIGYPSANEWDNMRIDNG